MFIIFKFVAHFLLNYQFFICSAELALVNTALEDTQQHANPHILVSRDNWF